jgi:hypothetical protein
MQSITRRLTLFIFLVILLQHLAPASTALRVVRALPAAPGLTHCTDWAEAKKKDAGTDDDQPIVSFETYVNFATGSEFNPLAKVSLDAIPRDGAPGWRVLLRPNQPFALFYSKTNGSADAIQDPAPGSNHNADSAAGDTVPDFAERARLARTATTR